MHLSTFALAMIAAGAIALIGLAYLLIGWLRKRSGRVLARGAGVILAAVGLMIMGWMELAVEGVRAVIAWANDTAMTTRIEIGLVVLGIGVIAFVVGSFMNPIIGDQAKQRRAALAEKRAAKAGLPPKKSAGQPGAAPSPAVAAKPSTAATAPTPVPAADDATDEEIDAILRRHGIQ
jgi:hypothetical protein